MNNLRRNLRVILIGGSSHTGKSTLAEILAMKLGWAYRSTDELARHPGRPWRQKPETVPEHVAKHYLSLSIDELFSDVLRHYRKNVWPEIEKIVTSHTVDRPSDRLIIEGSALWPDSVATLDFQNVAAIYFTVAEDVFKRRIHAVSQYNGKTSREKELIDKFLKRTLLYDERMIEAINRHGLIALEVHAAWSLEKLSDKCLKLVKKQYSITPNAAED